MKLFQLFFETLILLSDALLNLEDIKVLLPITLLDLKDIEVFVLLPNALLDGKVEFLIQGHLIEIIVVDVLVVVDLLAFVQTEFLLVFVVFLFVFEVIYI